MSRLACWIVASHLVDRRDHPACSCPFRGYNGWHTSIPEENGLNSASSGRAPRVVRTVLLLIFTTGTVACSRSTPAAERGVADARALFAQACAKCHAEDGTGGLPAAANGPRPVDLTSAEWQRSRSDAEIAEAIKNGRGAMPPFADVLTTDQIDALASYIRALERR
jgi:mono/diheme cytochrome c family protein